MPLPEYTDAARANRIEGIVMLQVVIHKDGSVTVKKVLRGLGYGLDEKANRHGNPDNRRSRIN
jgi:TonB family protein